MKRIILASLTIALATPAIAQQQGPSLDSLAMTATTIITQMRAEILNNTTKMQADAATIAQLQGQVAALQKQVDAAKAVTSAADAATK